ncbi:heptaprenyl diphosphate synthase component 1 [Bacillus sp. 1P06AnD]|uniref:heptaprenyl diphosphate synthase component 1 n=1 Tax=Bacillus sp. 1P06AnD TaxID=3132208 RepID=UPI00399F8B22
MENLVSYSKELRDYILSKAYHPYLRRYLNEPFIDEQKILLLLLILDGLKLSSEEKKQYICATLLVQSALDVHNDVTSFEGQAEEDALKLRQLTVLAADYYSGLYYSILSDMENNDLIQSLSEGIMDINEKKIVLYEKHYTDVSSLLETVKWIEASLLIKVEECFTIPRYKGFLGNILLLERLMREQQSFIKEKESPVYQAFSRLLFSKDTKVLSSDERHRLMEQVDNQMQEIYAACVNELQQNSLQDSPLTVFYRKQLQHERYKMKSYVEEG